MSAADPVRQPARIDVQMPGGWVARDIAVTPLIWETAHRSAAGDVLAGLMLHQAIGAQLIGRALLGGGGRRG